MLLALLACAAPGEPELLLTGWEYDWEQLSHRVSYVRVGVEPDSSLQLGLVGGDWSTGTTFTDTPQYRVRYQRVTAAGIGIARGTVTFEVGPEPEGTASLEIDATDLPTNGELVAIINGFHIDTSVDQVAEYPADYNPAYGYTSNGFGFSLGVPERDGDVVRVPVTATVRWGPQDREDVNAAIPFAVTEVGVDVAIIAGATSVESLALGASADYPRDPPYTDQEPMPSEAAFDGGAAEGFIGWKSFDLQANVLGPSAGEGDYLRAFGAEAWPTDVQAGTWNGSVLATISTSSAIEFTQLTSGFTGELLRIGAPDVIAEHRLVSGTHPTGLAYTDPTWVE